MVIGNQADIDSPLALHFARMSSPLKPLPPRPSMSRSAAAVSSVIERKKKSAPLDGFVHPDNWDDEDQLRRARLQIRFGVVLGLMSIAYAAFFLAIGHHWGGYIIGISGLFTTMVPWVVRKTGNLNLTGYLYGFGLLVGFTGLCSVDGGILGNAVAWLAAAPLVVLLLVDLRGALTWSVVAFATVVTLAVCEIFGYSFPTTYDPEWASAVASVSMVGLVCFLGTLGLIFELTRREAARRMDFANEQLAAANSDLHALNRERAEFINIAAHGLRNPLGIVTGYADLLRMQEDLSAEQIHRQAGEILTSAGRMTDIISNLLDVQAIEDERMELQLNKFDMTPLITTVFEENMALAVAKQISLSMPAVVDLPPVKGDQDAVHQILENLVSNAIKYTPIGGKVNLSIGHNDDMVVVEVIDDGPGLSQDDQSKLFEKFSRLTPRPTGGEPSSGLGLWITRRLAVSMGGSVFCRSEEGEGSSFGVSLPIYVASSEEEEDTKDTPAVSFVPGEPLLGREPVKESRDDIALSN